MDVLHYLDVAIGFALAMIVLTTLIGTTTAMWLATIQSKVRNLENGLQQVMEALGDGLAEAEQLGVVKRLLRGKMTNSWSPVRWLGLGATEAVGREEFILLLLREAAGDNGGKLSTAIQAITGELPETTLRAVETEALAQEAASPSEPSNVWRTRALAEKAPVLAARIFSQFDDVLVRTDDNTNLSRKITGGVLAFIFLAVYPVNSFDLIARLMNDKAVAALIANTAATEADQTKLQKAIDDNGLFGQVFATNAPGPTLKTLREPGVWTTFVLVCLGAPFWQGWLDRLLGLRSKITAKTQQERAQRALKS
jgi:hypothetical protein